MLETAEFLEWRSSQGWIQANTENPSNDSGGETTECAGIPSPSSYISHFGDLEATILTALQMYSVKQPCETWEKISGDWMY